MDSILTSPINVHAHACFVSVIQATRLEMQARYGSIMTLLSKKQKKPSMR